MKRHLIFVVIVFLILLSGCIGIMSSSSSNTGINAITSTAVAQITPATPMHSSFTIHPPLNTYTSDQAEKALEQLMTRAMDCSAPCFWGITPGESTEISARKLFDTYGLFTNTRLELTGKYLDTEFDIKENLGVIVSLWIEKDIVKNISIWIIPGSGKESYPRDWSAFTPDTLLNRSGVPSLIEFSSSKYGPNEAYLVWDMYFDEKELIVEYSGDNVLPDKKGLSQACLLDSHYQMIRVWLGENPKDPPSHSGGLSLEEVSKLNKVNFVQLMTGEPRKACFEIDRSESTGQ